MLQSVYFEVKNVQDKHDLKQMKKGLDTLYGVLSCLLYTSTFRKTTLFCSIRFLAASETKRKVLKA